MAQTSKMDYTKPVNITQRGLEEIMMGDPSRPAEVYSPAGILEPTYVGDVPETPAILINAEGVSGGMTTQDAVKRAYENNAAQEVERLQQISSVVEGASLPEYYNRASLLKQGVKQVKAAVGGASEFFGKIVGDATSGAYANAIAANYASTKWRL